MSTPSDPFYLLLTRLLSQEHIGVSIASATETEFTIETWHQDREGDRSTFTLPGADHDPEEAIQFATMVREHYMHVPGAEAEGGISAS